MLDRPTGRAFFEEIIRENLDLGRPSGAADLPAASITQRTPGLSTPASITQGSFLAARRLQELASIKQYHKEGRALRTETTINNTHDFGVGRSLHNLPALARRRLQANRRLLDVQSVSHDCAIGEDAFDQVARPIQVDGQRATALRFGEPRTQALLQKMLPATSYRPVRGVF